MLSMELRGLWLTCWIIHAAVIWNLSGLPCAHAMAAMREHRVKVEDYVDDYYSIEKYKKAYVCTINPINGRNLWEQVGVQIHSLEFKDTKKNLAFKRKPEEGESSCRRSKRCGTGQVSRKGQKHTCSKCGGVGHTKKTCKVRASFFFYKKK